MCGGGATEGVSFNEHKSVCDVMLCSQLCRLLEEVIDCHSVMQTASAKNLSCTNFSLQFLGVTLKMMQQNYRSVIERK